jgi:membrane-associated HD superfamily phosphohydrolase
MSMQPRFETARETAVISKILTDLVRTVQLIECEIAAQDLKRTIDALEQRLAERAPHEQATAA